MPMRVCRASLVVTLGLAPVLAQRFVPAEPALPQLALETRSLACGDVDGDGDQDLVVGNVGQTRLYRNDGRGGFTDVTAEQLPVNRDTVNAIVLADFDGDGDLDMLLGGGGWIGGRIRLWCNDGRGHFRQPDPAPMPDDYDWTNGVACGDVDGDGDPDLVLARYGRPRLWRNDKGRFTDVTEARMPALRVPTMALALGDVDGDGDLDLVLGNSIYERNRLYRNDGGTFRDVTEDQLPADQADTLAVLLADLDGDGDLDLVCGNGRLGGEQSRLYRNDGHGRFTDVTAACFPRVLAETNALALADLDGDGAPDLVLGNAAGRRGAQSLAWRNDGKGGFTDVTAAWLPPRSERTVALLAFDADGDGRPELLLGNGKESGAQSLLLRAHPPRAGR